MKNRIIENLNNPGNLEKLYQDNKDDFRKLFTEIPNDYNSDLITFWKIRLASEAEIKYKEFSKSDLFIVIFLSLITGLLAKLPGLFSQINDEFFYTRDLAIIVFNGIILYTFWQNRFSDKKRILIYALIVLILTLFINLLPNLKSDSIFISLIHIPLFLWFLFGLAFISFDYNNIVKRIEFIRFNGELLIKRNKCQSKKEP